MTKILLLMRHAKSSWKDETLADHDRPLNRRGKRDAPRMGRLLREQDVLPDLIVSSTARRARATATSLVQAAAYQGEVRLTDDLYHSGVADLLNVIRQLSDQHSSVLLIGHNPGMVDLLEHLTGDGQTLPTAALAQLQLHVPHWSQVDQGSTATLINLWRPRDLT